MRNIAKLAGYSIGIVLAGSVSAVAATNCPQFLIASGYADLCSPTAWMAFEHQDHRDDRLIKRRLHNPKASKPAKIKFKPRRGSKSASK
jgi:hypothetical protein